MEYAQRDHAWIATWGRKNGKTYVVVVMVEHGGGGSSVAGPVAKKVYEHLFGPDEGAPRARPATETPQPQPRASGKGPVPKAPLRCPPAHPRCPRSPCRDCRSG